MKDYLHRDFDTPQAFVEGLLEVMEFFGGITYFDSGVTQVEHALQTATLAQQAGAADSLVVAALLHDVGHLMIDEHDAKGDFLHSDLRHEAAGARLLNRCFGPDIVVPVSLHVRAKRYLVKVEPQYAAMLSPPTRRSLLVQGGPLSSQEAASFAALPYADAAIALRRWDDHAKVPGEAVPRLRDFVPLVLGQASSQNLRPSMTG
jgi:phosphonate degradation associated HDIG domain protein